MTVQQLPFPVIAEEMRRLRNQKPLVHCLTNEVVQNFTANGLLAVGASPAMVVAQQEVAQFVALADSLLINVGTLYQARLEAMLLAAETADKTQTPWVLDPVAVGALTYRTDFVRRLLAYKPTVIRANASEILALAGFESQGKGADSADSTLAALPAAQALALEHQTIVAMTGDIDYITNGTVTWSLPWGHPMMTLVTGCGCTLSAIVAAFIAKTTDPMPAAAAACAVVAICGQRAVNDSHGPGTFVPHFIDRIYHACDDLTIGATYHATTETP
jgi:hydroxyethylthiazole kinase